MDRRRFLLSGSLAAVALSTGWGLYAAPVQSPRFLLVFLRGGYDWNNTLVPYASDFYYESRPTIAIARPDAANPGSAIALDSQWGLTPSLRESILPMFQRKEVAFVPFAGTGDLSRSHFETQDDIEAGQPEQGRRDFRSGFLARLSGTLTGVQPIAFTDSLPRSFKGGGEIPNVSLKDVSHPGFDARQSQILAGMYRDHPLHQQVMEGLELRQEVSKEFSGEMNAASRGAVSPRGFELEARRIAAMMRGRYRLGFVDVGGWDTHVNQGGADGQLAKRLESLGSGLAAFAQEMGTAWNDTVVVVISEFGRTFRENGNNGTDHGHGSAYWVLGGGVRGGRFAGEQVRVERATLLQDRDHPVLNDYRGVLGGLFSRMWGLSAERVRDVFPDAKPIDLQLT